MTTDKNIKTYTVILTSPEKLAAGTLSRAFEDGQKHILYMTDCMFDIQIRAHEATRRGTLAAADIRELRIFPGRNILTATVTDAGRDFIAGLPFVEKLDDNDAPPRYAFTLRR